MGPIGILEKKMETTIFSRVYTGDLGFREPSFRISWLPDTINFLLHRFFQKFGNSSLLSGSIRTGSKMLQAEKATKSSSPGQPIPGLSR